MDYGRAHCELKVYYCANDEEELKGWGECPTTLSVTTTFLMGENATGVLWRMKRYCFDDVSPLLVF